MARFPAVRSATTVLMAATAVVATAGTAGATPAQLPTPGESAACEQAWTPQMDPRVSMRGGLGTLAFLGWVHGQCNSPDARFPNGAAVAGSGIEPEVPAWQRLPPPGAHDSALR